MTSARPTTAATFTADTATGVAVVDFWAPWCGPCKAFAPVFDASAGANPQVAHLKVNVDDEPGLAVAHGISSIPTTIVLRDGAPVAAATGALNAGRLADLLARA